MAFVIRQQLPKRTETKDEDNMRLKNKIVIITGASSGIGEQTAELFAKEGVTVIAVARRADKLKELADRCQAYGGKVYPESGDMSQKEDIERVVKDVIEKYERVDVLVNNAGKADDFLGAAEMSDEMWDDVLALNLDGPFYMTRAVLAHMLKMKKGVIVNTASVAGIEYSRGGLAYTVSKHGVVALTKHTAFNYAADGIRCNAIAPGTVETPLVANLAEPKNVNPEGFKKATSGSANAPRSGKPEEIAAIALFLASDESSFVNGTVVVADAGWTCY